MALDLTPRMLELGRAGSAAEGLDIEWVEGDAEELPFDDDGFDVAASSFGVMFAPRPELAAAELFRVVGSGGTVGLANMTPQGYLGRLIAIASSYAPAPLEGLPPPLLWGEPEVMRERLEDLAESVEIQTRMTPMRFESKQATLEFHERYNGPLIALRSALPRDR